MLKTKHIEEEIWRLKNQDKPIIKQETVPPNLIDTPIDQRNLKDERVFRLASESAAEEAEMEFNSLLEEFREWKKNNKGTFKDFLKSNKDDVKVIKISKILADRKVAKDGGPIDKAKGGRVKLSSGGFLSRDTLISMLRNEYPSEYIKLSESGFDKVSTKEISELLDTLDIFHDKIPN